MLLTNHPSFRTGRLTPCGLSGVSSEMNSMRFVFVLRSAKTKRWLLGSSRMNSVSGITFRTSANVGSEFWRSWYSTLSKVSVLFAWGFLSSETDCRRS